MKKTILLFSFGLLLTGIMIPKLFIKSVNPVLDACAKIEGSLLFDHPLQKLLSLKVVSQTEKNKNHKSEATAYTLFGIPYKTFEFDCITDTTFTNNQAKVAVIALSDNGKQGKKIGCDDSLVYLTKTNPSPSSQPLNEAFKFLFGLETQSFSDSAYPETELTNIIYSVQRTEGKKVLFFDRAELAGPIAKIYLTGSMGSIGGVCDEPRVIEQISGTALQFPEVKTVEVYLNNQLFDLKTFYSAK